MSSSLLTPKLPPYMRKKSPPGGFFGKAVPPNSPHHLTMSIPVFTSAIATTPNESHPSSNGTSPTTSPKFSINLPRGLVPMQHQVAGHTFQPDNPNELGLLKHGTDGTVLKPAGKAACGARELKFYESLRQPDVPDYLASLRCLVPRYSGAEVLCIEGRDVNFIRLEDLTDRMLEPCVMDVKIGRRTWDPLATPEKRAAEESKYVACKQSLGFCVPGFQVHSVRTGRVKRFGKEYGKKLNEESVREAFRIFLNADSGGLCRSLLMQFLSGLWAIQSWARTQSHMRIYSSSVLLVYDTRRLREVLEANKRRPQSPQQQQLTPPPSMSNGNTTPTGGNGFSLHRSVSSASSSSRSSMGSPGCGGEPIQSFKKIQRIHSMNNNYDQVGAGVCYCFYVVANCV